MKMLRAVLVASTALALSAQLLAAQAGQVTCKDGSKSKGGRGACSSHGGILKGEAKMAAKADAKAVKADVKADAKAAKANTKVAATAEKAETKIAKTAAKADAKIEKTAAAADAKMAKTEKAEKKAPTKKAKAKA